MLLKVISSILAVQVIAGAWLGYSLWKDGMLSMDIGNTVLVGMTTDYTAPIGYFEYYMGKESGYQNKYFGYYMSQYNIGVQH